MNHLARLPQWKPLPKGKHLLPSCSQRTAETILTLSSIVGVPFWHVLSSACTIDDPRGRSGHPAITKRPSSLPRIHPYSGSPRLAVDDQLGDPAVPDNLGGTPTLKATNWQWFSDPRISYCSLSNHGYQPRSVFGCPHRNGRRPR